MAVEPMPEESEDSYLLLFRTLQERGLTNPRGGYSCRPCQLDSGYP